VRVITATFDHRTGAGQAVRARQLARRLSRAFAEHRPWIGSEIDSQESWVGVSTRLDVITNEPASERDRELMLRFEAGSLAWSGYVRGELNRRPSSLQVSRLGGSFAIVEADDERIIAWTSAHRMEPLYFAEGRNLTVLSTSARIAHAITSNRTPIAPEEALLGLSGPGFMISDQTTFPGVRALPGDSETILDGRGLATSKLPGPPVDEQTPLPEVVDAVSTELLSAAEFHAERGHATRCHITGGKDSRLVLAALSRVGAVPTAVTAGFPEHPDALVGRRVAATLGMPHELWSPKLDTRAESLHVDPRSRAYKTLIAAESMLTSYEALNPQGDRYRRGTPMGGYGGELLRGGFGYRLNRMDVAPALRRIDLVGLPHAKLLSNEGQDLAVKVLGPWRNRASDSPERALADFYLVLRAGRWRAVSQNAESISHPTFSLLADNQVVRLAMATSQGHTWDERLAFMVLENLAPGLAKIPFFRSRWNFEHDAPSSLLEPSSWKERDPVEVDEGRGAFNWRIDYPSEIHSHFTEVLLEPTRLHEVIDRSHLVRFMDQTSNTRTGAEAKTVWSMYTAQQLLLGLAAHHSPPDPMVFEVSVPP
jgi:hypothetical protein